MKTKMLNERAHLSFSALNEYVICPLKFYFHRVEKRKPECTSINLILGKALHRVYAEGMNCRYREGSHSLERDEMVKIFLMDFDSQVLEQENINYGKSDYDEALKQGIVYAKTLVDFLTKKEPCGEEIWIEREFMVPMATNLKVFELPIMGIFDAVLINHQEKLVTIIDFKTSSTRYPEWKIQRNLQSLIYTYGVRHLLERDYRIAFRWEVLLKYKAPKIEEYDYLCSDEELEYLLQVIQGIGKGIEQEVFYPNPSFICGGCEYLKACRAWPGRPLGKEV